MLRLTQLLLMLLERVRLLMLLHRLKHQSIWAHHVTDRADRLRRQRRRPRHTNGAFGGSTLTSQFSGISPSRDRRSIAAGGSARNSSSSCCEPAKTSVAISPSHSSTWFRAAISASNISQRSSSVTMLLGSGDVSLLVTACAGAGRACCDVAVACERASSRRPFAPTPVSGNGSLPDRRSPPNPPGSPPPPLGHPERPETIRRRPTPPASPPARAVTTLRRQALPWRDNSPARPPHRGWPLPPRWRKLRPKRNPLSNAGQQWATSPAHAF
ncbi:unnamed protein product [Trichogramma brassicae]|uniref:Uncharacterized protein n=1 Tax=Trichogramma brassicae TaxID=86971 RepID=A0A6H5IXD3_9HYME|nr:unnamed protein product [Trichogramma brassicae]